MSDQLTDEGLGRLRAVARRHVGDDRVPGLVALVACGDQVHADWNAARNIELCAAGLAVNSARSRPRAARPSGSRMREPLGSAA